MSVTTYNHDCTPSSPPLTSTHPYCAPPLSLQLGYVNVNLAEYAGAGLTQRKYLLQSYGEHKQRADNSILKVSVCMKQTSGDVVFKA